MIQILSVFLYLFTITFSSDWKEALSKNGVTVYERATANSKIKSVKFKLLINSTPEKIIAIISNPAGFPNWVYKCREGKVVKAISTKEFYYYQVTKAPFPVQDRDVFAHTKISKKNDETVIIVTAEPEFEKAKKGIVRIKLFNSTWRLKKVKNQTEVINELSVDPGGGIPAWIINSVITQGPYNTALGLRKVAEAK